MDFIIYSFFFANPELICRADWGICKGFITELQGRVYNVTVFDNEENGFILFWTGIYGKIRLPISLLMAVWI
jgi:hypothetical protein